MHGQEVGRVAERLDQPQLMLEQTDHLVRHALGIAPGSTFPGQPGERLLRCQAGDRDLGRILVGQLREREAAAVGDLERARQCLGVAGKQALHLG